MQRMIFVNLPVKDLAVSRAFYAALGFSFNDMFSNESCTYVIVEDNIALMLLTEERFRDFINNDITDTSASNEALVCLSCESREQVDATYHQALTAGGKPWRPGMDEGYMYGQSFTDPDGHVIELMWMDVAAATQQG